ncbi:DUF2474 domain-containing protein [Variovorax jilinensis]
MVRVWGRRLAWLAAFWMAGVAATGALAWVLKLLMRAVGLAG